MSVQAQWSLNAISSAAFEVARGVLHAATSDNVQPLAILACENFGNTIAMSPDTCYKVEKSILPTPQPVPIEFLRAFVGFSKDDTATQLGRSSAGVRFLALAAALTTTVGPFDGAQALQRMLTQSAADKTLLPALKQLRDLLAALEPRCHGCGFADSVLGWHAFLWHCRGPEEPQYKSRSIEIPSPEGLEKIVDAFRQLCRIGNAQISRVTIKSNLCTAWITAFTKWCLGMPPSVYLWDGSPIMEQEGSQVDLFVLTGEQAKHGSLQLIIHYALESPTELYVPGTGKGWDGMVNITSFGRKYLQDHDLDSGMVHRAIVQAIPYATSEALSKVRFSKYLQFSHKTTRNIERAARGYLPPQIDDELIKLGLSPFRSKHNILKALSLLMDLKDIDSLPALDQGLQVFDLPAVRLLLKTLESECSCTNCGKLPSYSECKKTRFQSQVATLVALILVLSLIQPIEDLKIRAHVLSAIAGLSFVRCVREVLDTGRVGNTSQSSLLQTAMSLVGHEAEDDIDDMKWIMSSSKGIVVYPTIFETQVVERLGFLSLSWLPGTLSYKGETYTRVIGYDFLLPRPDPRLTPMTDKVSGPRNNFRDMKLAWETSIGDRLLQVSLGLSGPRNETLRMINPGRLFANLSEVLLIDKCSHDRHSLLTNTDRFCRYTSPSIPNIDSSSSDICTVGVVAVDGAQDLRFLSLSNLFSPAILRGDACLACCLDICRRVNYPVVVL